MVKKESSSKQLNIKINSNVYKELDIIAKNVGFDNLEMLVRNYLREVALAARSEVATQETRIAIFNNSPDLDHLKVDTKPQTSKSKS